MTKHHAKVKVKYITPDLTKIVTALEKAHAEERKHAGRKRLVYSALLVALSYTVGQLFKAEIGFKAVELVVSAVVYFVMFGNVEAV